MSIFNKNSNERAFVNGKKHWIDVIKNTGPGELLIWRQPEEDFNTNSTLVVMPGEEAIFIKDGTVEQIFENGTYNLSTENYPFISRLRNAFSGGVSTFNCVVYFVRKSHSMEVLWGTDSPIQVRDRVWGIRTDIRARGSYKIKIDNPVLFLSKMLGNNIPFLSQPELNAFFSNQFQSIVKTKLSNTLNLVETELIGIESQLEEFSNLIEPQIDEVLKEYGLKCINFVVSAADVDSTKYDTIDQAQMESVMKTKSALGDRNVMDVLGEDWGKQQAANILGDLAKNPGAGGIASAGAGIGLGMAAGSTFGAMAQQLFAPMNNRQDIQYNNEVSNSVDRFKPKQDTEVKYSTDPVEVLSKLKQMLEQGLIEESEYNKKKAEVMERM